jgi:uncharacterized protein (TIGR02217 family)
MSNALYPILTGQAFPRVRMPRFKTQVDESATGRDWTSSGQLYPRYTYKIPYNYLSAADFAVLMGFFNARRGRLDTFLFDDRDDNNVVSPQSLGLGTGTQTKFALLRTYGGFVEQVGRANVMGTVRVNGVATTAYTVGDDGSITFSAAPPNGQAVDWTGTYYWRCRFVQDTQEFSEFMRNMREARTVEFETVKP